MKKIATKANKKIASIIDQSQMKKMKGLFHLFQEKVIGKRKKLGKIKENVFKR